LVPEGNDLVPRHVLDRTAQHLFYNTFECMTLKMCFTTHSKIFYNTFKCIRFEGIIFTTDRLSISLCLDDGTVPRRAPQQTRQLKEGSTLFSAFGSRYSTPDTVSSHSGHPT
jgi:hypothetical protein